VSVVPWSDLGKSGQPMVDVVSRAAPWLPRWVFSFIALFAITNTALLNYVMGSRLLYGMARQGFLPRALGDVHPTRRTPHKAIFALLAVTTVLALSGDISTLASATSVILLGVFLVVHASLLALRRRESEPKGAFEVPWPVPVLGIAVCAAVLAHATPAAFRIAGFLLLGVAALYAITRPKHLREEDLVEPG
jgi:amino acid transporter